MRSPSKFPRVLDTAYCIVAAICTFLGLAGYYMYGDGSRDVITFNMSAGDLPPCLSAVCFMPYDWLGRVAKLPL
jgi:solute carrier family 32 (vesicular inhibitory amino acid transporter)